MFIIFAILLMNNNNNYIKFEDTGNFAKLKDNFMETNTFDDFDFNNKDNMILVTKKTQLFNPVDDNLVDSISYPSQSELNNSNIATNTEDTRKTSKSIFKIKTKYLRINLKPLWILKSKKSAKAILQLI